MAGGDKKSSRHFFCKKLANEDVRLRPYGLRMLLGENYDNFLEEIVVDHAEAVAQVAARRNLQLDDADQRLEAADEFLAEMAENDQNNSVWQQIAAAFRRFLRSIGFDLAWSDADLRDLLRRSRATLKQNLEVDGNGTVTDGNERGITEFNGEERGITETNGNERNGTEFADDKAFPIRSENDYAAVRNILHNIQGNILDNEDTGIKAKLSSTGVNKMLSNKARSKSKNNGFEDAEHLLAAANVDRLFANAVLMEDRPDRNNDPNIVSIKRFSAPFYTNGQFAEARLTVKESIEHGNRLYSLELDEIKKPSSPDRGGLDEQADTPALDGYNKLVRKIKNASAKIKNNSSYSRHRLYNNGDRHYLSHAGTFRKHLLIHRSFLSGETLFLPVQQEKSDHLFH